VERTDETNFVTTFFRSYPAALLREVRPDDREEHILGRFAFGWWFSVPVALLTGRFG
jgi:hypothetical protein